MAWVAGNDVTTGDLITAAQWNNYLGAAGSLEWLYDNKKNKELWVPVTAYEDGGVNEPLDAIDELPIAPLVGAGDEGWVSFRCPADFNAITTASLVVLPRTTDGAANYDIDSCYGALGEDHDNHNEADFATTYNVTNGKLFAIDASGILSSLAADDYVGLRCLADGTDDFYLIGFYMIYT